MKVTYVQPTLPADGFAADMHFHTCHSYDCRTPVRDVVARAAKLNLRVAITDHNKISGVLEAKKFPGSRIIPAVELCGKEGKEIIPYFYDTGQLQDFYSRVIAPKFREKNPLRTARTKIPMADIFDALSHEECVVHVPHPFGKSRGFSYGFFATHPAMLRRVDSIEVFNEMLSRKANLAALGWAAQLGKGIAGGSDGHSLGNLGRGVTLSGAQDAEGHLKLVKRGRVEVNGRELHPMKAVLQFARTSGRMKLQNGIKRGLFGRH